MPTKREQLEKLVADMKYFGDTIDRTPGGPRPQDIADLNAMGAKVTSLVTAIKAESAGDSRHDFLAHADRFGGPAPTEYRSTRSSLGAPPLGLSDEDLKSLQDAALGRKTELKAAVSSTTAPMAAIGDYRTDVFAWLRDKPRILSHIPTETTTAPSVYYYRATAAASAATAVAEGTAKPESTPTWESVTAVVRKLAHYTRVNDEVLADFANFSQVISQEMLAGLIDQENHQLLNGTGVAPNILGLANTVGIQTVGSAGTDLDAVAAGINAIRTVVFTEPDIIIMHPNDWASTGFSLAKDTSGQYLLGNALSATTPSLWGVPVLLTTRQTENTLLIANLKQAAKVYVRQSPVVEVAPYGGGTTEFIANQTLVRAETRLALTVVRPQAICSVTAV